MATTKMYFESTNPNDPVTEEDRFELNRWAIGRTYGTESSKINITPSTIEVVFDANVPRSDRDQIVSNLTTNLPLTYLRHEVINK